MSTLLTVSASPAGCRTGGGIAVVRLCRGRSPGGGRRRGGAGIGSRCGKCGGLRGRVRRRCVRRGGRHRDGRGLAGRAVGFGAVAAAAGGEQQRCRQCRRAGCQQSCRQETASFSVSSHSMTIPFFLWHKKPEGAVRAPCAAREDRRLYG
ncbi:MAG: hypothetical protein DBX65_06005 [Oscillospiraceae bacterium]|nr:MAG: hypothetical protein DBX65_06005 [Oscillospiraceae bacterium]